MADRTLVVKILGDDKSLRNAFARSSKDSKRWGDSINRAARGGVVATVGFRGLGRSVAFASGAFLGGAGFVAAAKGAVTAASNLSEQLNKTNVLFGQSAKSVKEFSKTTATSLGLSQRAALEAAGGFGAMLETAGLTSAEAAKFSKRLVQLGSDMASFNNIDPSEALLKLKSGLAGEAEPLRTVGVLLSETRVKQEAYRSGLAKAGATLTEQQKVLARYALILQDTAKQQGDFGRTSGGLANQQRILAAQVENLQARLGEALLPDILKVVKALNAWLSSSENQARVQRAVNDGLRTAESVFQAVLEVARPLAKAAQDVASALGGTKNAVKLLIAAFVASKVISFTGAITGLGTQALTAEGRVRSLRLSLLRLGAIGVITLGIEVLINRESIERSVNDFLRKNRAGFLTGTQLELPFEVKVKNLEKFQELRERIADAKGEGDLMVKALDKIIGRLQKVATKSSQIGRADPLHAALSERGGRVQKVGAVEAIDNIIDQTQAALTRLGNLTKSAKARAIKDFGKSMDDLARALTIADSTPQLQDNLRILQRELSLVNKEIQIEGRTKDLLDQRVSITADITNIQRDIAESAKDAGKAAKVAGQEQVKAAREAAIATRKAEQFQKLGLTREGGQRVPGVAALSRRLTSLKDQVKGTVLDTPKTQQQLQRIARVLAGKFGKVGKDVRSAILQMFQDIAGALDQGGKKVGPLTKTSSLNSKKLLEGIGLSPEEIRELRGRLSNFNSAGVGFARTPKTATTGGFVSGGFVVENNITVEVGGQKIEAVVTKEQQKRKRRNPQQKRGPNRR